MKAKPAKIKTSCPWCQSKEAPIPTDPSVANFQYPHRNLEQAIKDNPAMCPECFGVGGYVDWGL